MKGPLPAAVPRADTPAPAEIEGDDSDIRAATIPPALAGQRIDQALAQLFPEFSRSRLKGWLEAGRITIDGVGTEPSAKARGGEAVLLDALPDPSEVAFVAEAMSLPIVFEDDTLIVIDKPAGMVVHPGAGNWGGTLLNGLLAHDPALASVPRAGIVHRLDKDTTGLMVVAKTIVAQTDLVRQLQERTVRREYLALVHGLVDGDGTIDAPIGRHPRERTQMAVVANGKPAVTHVVVMERFDTCTLVRCRLETGRTHQIRVHLTHVGHPLVGDPTYRGRVGQRGPIEFGRQALHAERLGLRHPATGRTMGWSAPLPADFAELLDELRA
jgi:23S rRNA pseudouridine1911/1915/1917 synthase